MAGPGPTIVALPAVVDLDSIDGVRDRLLEAMELGAVCVSAETVERVSTNALLMLLSAARTARHGRISFEVSSVSLPMTAAIDRLGLTTHFADLARG